VHKIAIIKALPFVLSHMTGTSGSKLHAEEPGHGFAKQLCDEMAGLSREMADGLVGLVK
jgi:hypothetical protein